MQRVRQMGIVAAFCAAPLGQVQAQTGLTFWAGYAQSADSGAVTMDTKGLQASVQLGLPLFPFAVRAEALHWGTEFDANHLSYMGSGLLQIRLPLLQLYGVGGLGRFALTDSTTVNGWHAGAGIRLGQGRFGLFGEVRRIDPVARTVTTLGLTF